MVTTEKQQRKVNSWGLYDWLIAAFLGVITALTLVYVGMAVADWLFA